jgi:hypothetical protein
MDPKKHHKVPQCACAAAAAAAARPLAELAVQVAVSIGP